MRHTSLAKNDPPAQFGVTPGAAHPVIYLEIGRVDAIMESHEINYGDKDLVTGYSAGGRDENRSIHFA